MQARTQPGGSYVYDDAAEPDWRPLEQVARICRDHPALPDLDPDDFMYMGRYVHPPTRHEVLAYKHLVTRRYLHLDHAGHAYTVRLQPECLLPGFDVDVVCRVRGDLTSAVEHTLDLAPEQPPRHRGPSLAL